jgi:hypothetical protein
MIQDKLTNYTYNVEAAFSSADVVRCQGKNGMIFKL